MHSGRQEGGEPIKLGKHEHVACLFTALHWLLGPHGLGLQGCICETVTKNPCYSTRTILLLIKYLVC